MSMITLTPMEATTVEEALEYSKDELRAAEEQTEYVLTTGALELILQALNIIKKARAYTNKKEDEELLRAFDDVLEDNDDTEDTEEDVVLDFEKDYPIWRNTDTNNDDDVD